MINLITGGPGSGKTCLLIGELLKYQSEQRNLLVHGVPGLTIPHTRLYCESKTCTVCETVPDDALYAKDWPAYTSTGDVIILDEVQHIWRPRSVRNDEKAPRGLTALETARHQGLDFWFITQNPKLLDVHARRMVTRHQHIKYSPVFGRTKYEWAECQDDITKNWTGDTVKSLYKLNKKHFPLYKSADLHTVQERKKPLTFYAYMACFLLLPLAIYFAWSSFANFSESSSESVASIAESLEPVVQEDSFSSPISRIRPSAFFDTGSSDLFARTSDNVMQPENAPAYEPLVKIMDFPRLAGCIYSESKNICSCYTQQATRLDVPFQQCRAFIDKTPFNPYLPPAGVSSSNFSPPSSY